MKCPGVHIIRLNLPLGWLFLRSPQRTQPSLDACRALGRPVAHVAHDPAENCPPASGLCLLGPLGPGRGQACRVGEEGPQAGRPSFSGSPCRPWSSGLRVDVWGCPGRLLSPVSHPDPPTPFPPGAQPGRRGSLVASVARLPSVFPSVSLEPMVCHPGSYGFTWSDASTFPGAPTESDHSWRSPSAPRSNPGSLPFLLGPYGFVWTLTPQAHWLLYCKV